MEHSFCQDPWCYAQLQSDGSRCVKNEKSNWEEIPLSHCGTPGVNAAWPGCACQMVSLQSLTKFCQWKGGFRQRWWVCWPEQPCIATMQGATLVWLCCFRYHWDKEIQSRNPNPVRSLVCSCYKVISPGEPGWTFLLDDPVCYCWTPVVSMKWSLSNEWAGCVLASWAKVGLNAAVADPTKHFTRGS